MLFNLLPVLIVNYKKDNRPVNREDHVGWGLWGLGFLIEAIADYQKSQFKKDPSNAVSGRFQFLILQYLKTKNTLIKCLLLAFLLNNLAIYCFLFNLNHLGRQYILSYLQFLYRSKMVSSQC